MIAAFFSCVYFIIRKIPVLGYAGKVKMALSLHSKYFYKTNLKYFAINFVMLVKVINFVP